MCVSEDDGDGCLLVGSSKFYSTSSDHVTLSSFIVNNPWWYHIVHHHLEHLDLPNAGCTLITSSNTQVKERDQGLHRQPTAREKLDRKGIPSITTGTFHHYQTPSSTSTCSAPPRPRRSLRPTPSNSMGLSTARPIRRYPGWKTCCK
jgi:hypothetical protein